MIPPKTNQNKPPPGTTISTGEIIEARQALFFIAAILTLFSIYPLITSGFTIGIMLNLAFAISAFALGMWSKTNPVQAFKIGFYISLFFILPSILILNFFGVAVAGAFSLAFYRGWKYAKKQYKNNEPLSSRDDILDDGI